jgi:hypothetical protein
MGSQRSQDRRRLVRLLLISMTVIFLLVAGIVWIFNLGGTSWSTPLASLFVVLGVLFTFLQWAIPRSPTEPKLSNNDTQKIRQSYNEEIKSRLKIGTAALIIYTGKHNKKKQFKLVTTDHGDYWYAIPGLREYVGRINRSDYGAVFVDVPPSDYNIFITVDRPWFDKVLDFIDFVIHVGDTGITEESGQQMRKLETVKLILGEVKDINL